MNDKLADATIAETATIEEAFRRLNDNELGIVFATDGAGRVTGCVTDGDIRRQLLDRNDLTVVISSFLNRHFVHALDDAPREHILKLLDHRVHVVPVLDQAGRLVQICTREEFYIQEEAEVFARARAPARISFSGGGTDLTHHFFEQSGSVISATIMKYAHASLRRRSDGRIRIYSHDFGKTVEAADVAGLPFNGELDLVKSLIRLIAPSYGFDLEIATDFPIGSGLGGSASVAVAVLGCFNEFRADPWSRHQIAEMAFQAERIILKIAGGWQDQYAAAFGGFNFMEFSASENLIVPLRLEQKVLREMEASMVLCYTGKAHNSGEIHTDQKRHMQASPSARQATARQKEMTLEVKRLLLRGEIYGYGRLLHESWTVKRQLSNLISNDEIDRIYELAMANGAQGGKILGAGGGGYFMFFVPPFERYRLCNALQKIGLGTESVFLDETGLTSWKMRMPGPRQLSGSAARDSHPPAGRKTRP
jgi:D-glycero-alpha-D-manno-heptose-7-phosphate kinase